MGTGRAGAKLTAVARGALATARVRKHRGESYRSGQYKPQQPGRKCKVSGRRKAKRHRAQGKASAARGAGLGNLLQSREKYEDAIRSYELAIQYRPTLAGEHFLSL
ncbi:Protein of unknown function [Gryllus bimaculatus]|nr:Protein of unknown function [Gryllus bimaculatus]